MITYHNVTVLFLLISQRLMNILNAMGIMLIEYLFFCRWLIHLPNILFWQLYRSLYFSWSISSLTLKSQCVGNWNDKNFVVLNKKHICADHFPCGNESGRIDTFKTSQIAAYVLSRHQNIIGSLNFTCRPNHPIFW